MVFKLEEVASSLPDEGVFLLPDFGYMWLVYVCVVGFVLVLLSTAALVTYNVFQSSISPNTIATGLTVGFVTVFAASIPYLSMEKNWYEEASAVMDERLSSEELEGVHLFNRIFADSYSGELKVSKSDGSAVLINVDGRTVTFDEKLQDEDVDSVTKQVENLSDEDRQVLLERIEAGE